MISYILQDVWNINHCTINTFLSTGTSSFVYNSVVFDVAIIRRDLHRVVSIRISISTAQISFNFPFVFVLSSFPTIRKVVKIRIRRRKKTRTVVQTTTITMMNDVFIKKSLFRLFSVSRCSRCREGIFPSELVMRARDLVYHVTCFNCASCGTALNKGDHFGQRDGLVYCRWEIRARWLALSKGRLFVINEFDRRERRRSETRPDRYVIARRSASIVLTDWSIILVFSSMKSYIRFVDRYFDSYFSTWLISMENIRKSIYKKFGDQSRRTNSVR